MLSITREFGFDMGHCLPDHQGGCYRPHGHRYRLEVELTGEPVHAPGDPENGMVMDFGRLKALVTEHVVDVFDHRFVMCEHDPRAATMLDLFGPDSVLLVPEPPTAEYLIMRIATVLKLDAKVANVVGLALWETPNCRATWRAW